MTDVIWVINAGSSSIKSALYPAQATGADDPVYRAQISGIGHAARLRVEGGQGNIIWDETLADVNDHDTALHALLDWIESHESNLRVIAAGHRIVHGGASYAKPMLLTTAICSALRQFIPLAPLHQPFNLAAVDAIAERLQGLPQIACFDTAFHQTQSPVSTRFALPRWLADKGVRRYGFHGLSYEYIASVLPQHLGPHADGRVIVAHLGSGASLCALKDRRSVATTMGFSALDGLVMGRRCGTLDPGVLLYLMQEEGMNAETISHLLYEQSGLAGVSGISDDMRELLASDRTEAREAIDLFVYRINQEIGALAAVLGGVDAIVFTAGIGEHAPAIRASIAAAAGWLGARLDPQANAVSATCLSTTDSAISIWVIPTNEELMITRHVRDLLAFSSLQNPIGK